MWDIKEATQRAQHLVATGRLDEAIALQREAVAAFPGSSVALHNLAATLGDRGYWAEAEPVVRQALAAGLDAPETWLILARCMVGLNRFDEADKAYVAAIKRRPLTEAHRELVQLRWMRSAAIYAALAELDHALRASPGATDLIIVKAQALAEAEEGAAALAMLQRAVDAAPLNGELAGVLAQVAMAEGKPALAQIHADRAAALAPNSGTTLWVRTETLLNAGRAEEASRSAEAFRRAAPLDQRAIALQASAWRSLGDPRYQALYQYDKVLSVERLDAPSGWESLEAYLADLRDALLAAHKFRAHPFGQSLRRGSLIHHIQHLPHPAARALPGALNAPIRRYLAALGEGDDPLRARNTGRYAFQAMWSVLMQPGGRHIDHVHPQAWISSAFYVDVPTGMKENEGWIRFGESGLKVEPPQPAERMIEPVPGRLLLFPSYMWHGTTPFSGAQRLTVAFDLAPA